TMPLSTSTWPKPTTSASAATSELTSELSEEEALRAQPAPAALAKKANSPITRNLSRKEPLPFMILSLVRTGRLVPSRPDRRLVDKGLGRCIQQNASAPSAIRLP